MRLLRRLELLAEVKALKTSLHLHRVSPHARYFPSIRVIAARESVKGEKVGELKSGEKVRSVSEIVDLSRLDGTQSLHIYFRRLWPKSPYREFRYVFPETEWLGTKPGFSIKSVYAFVIESEKVLKPLEEFSEKLVERWFSMIQQLEVFFEAASNFGQFQWQSLPNVQLEIRTITATYMIYDHFFHLLNCIIPKSTKKSFFLYGNNVTIAPRGLFWSCGMTESGKNLRQSA